ncbi:MAG: PAS domain S-box protein, partial [Anaerolineales bacterium]
MPRLTGYSPEELNPQDWLKITHPEDLPIAQQHFQHLLSGQTDVCEVRIVMKTGEVRWLRNYARPIWDEAERRVVRVYGAVQDVTERKQTEAALRESEARFHVLSQAAFEGVAISEGGVLLEANERLALMLGYELNELIGKPVADLVAPEAREYAAQQIRSGSEQPYESIAQRKDGSTFPVKVQGRAMPYGGRTVRVAEVRDITERKQRERELEVIATVSAALRAAANGAEMPPIILDQVLTLLKTEGAALDVLDPASGEIVTELGRGAWAGVTGLRTPPGEGLSSHIIATGQPYVTDDVSLEPRVARPDLLGGLSTVACIPLITRAQTIGALWVGRKTPFTQYELRLVTAIADIAASALQRATLHDQTRQRLQQLAALRAIDFAISSSLDLRLTLNVVLEQVTSQLGVDAADVLLLNPHAHTLEFAAGRGFRSRAIERSVLRLGQGYPGRAALERRLVSLPNLADEEPDLTRAPLLEGEDFQAYFGIPLVAKGKVEGVLEVFHRAPLSPDPERLEFLETLAGQAAIAIDNAQLFNDLQRSNLNLTLAYDATIEGWSRALDLRDKETEGHTQRVTEMTLRLAHEMRAFDVAEL